LARAARRASLRLRGQAALDAFVQWSPVPLVGAIGAVTYLKLETPGPGVWQLLGALGAFSAASVLVPAVRAWRTTARGAEGALALDRHHGLEDRLTTALSFARGAAPNVGARGERSRAGDGDYEPADAALARSLRELAVADALNRAPRLEPHRAVPLRWPQSWPVATGLALGLGVLLLLRVEPPVFVAPDPLPPPERLALFDDDVALLREQVTELEQTSETPEALADIQRFNRLVEDVAAQRLDRREAFARLDALEREIRGSAKEMDALEEGLKELAQELEKSALSRPAGEALADRRLADAEEALRKLAERLRRKEDPPSRAELDQLRQSLQRASEASRTRREQNDPAAQERSALESERKRLLQKKAEGSASPQDLEQLARTERQLERLGRRKDQEKSAQGGGAEPLSELDRKLAEAARELAEAQGKSSDFLDQSAEAVGRMKQKQLSQKEKEQLLERMREMRDLLRQQKGGEQQKQWAERMRRMQRRAQGAPQEGQEGEGQGKPGSARPSVGRPGGVRLGPDGQPIPMAGQSPGQGAGKPGQNPGKGQGQEPGGNGPEPGTGHDPSVAGDPARAQGQTQDVMAVAPDTGEGTASSEVIYSAAQRGFTQGEYRRIFTEYETVAEDVIEREGIPPGYRSHVRRYFQLIRPRE
jgi:hypothetical protein